jgi:phage major head subunit gpT-like protein
MPDFQELDSRDVVAGFWPRFEETFDGSWAGALSFQIPSTRETEEYNWVGHAPEPRVWTGARIEGMLNKYSQTITNLEYEQTLAIPVPDLRRAKSAVLRARVGDMARKAALWPEKVITDNMTTLTTSYDGVNFYATTHNESGSNQSNDLANTDIGSLDVSSTSAVTPAEMSNIITEAIGYMYGLTDDVGTPINGDARNFIVMVGTANLFSAAIQSVRNSALASGADNPLMALTQAGVNITPIYNPRLSGQTTKIYVFRTDGVGFKPFVWQIEVRLQTQLIGRGSEEEFNNNRHKFGVYMSWGVGYGAWQHAQRLTIS